MGNFRSKNERSNNLSEYTLFIKQLKNNLAINKAGTNVPPRNSIDSVVTSAKYSSHIPSN